MVWNDHADVTDKLLAGSFTFECRIMHYIIYRILLPRSINLAHASEEDLILLWAFQIGRQIDMAHLVQYRIHKASRANAPLPYPHLVTFFLQYFNVPLDDEPFVKVKHSFAIGAGDVTSFGYRKDMDSQWVRKQDLPPPILDDIGKTWIVSGCASKTYHLPFPMSVHRLHHCNEMPLLLS